MAVFLGRTLLQLATRLAITAALVGLIYLAWYELALRNPQFRMGTAGESTIIVLVVAVALIFVSDPIATGVGLTLIPNYRIMSVFGDLDLDIANGQIAVFSLVLCLVVVAVLAFCVLRRRK